jgi:hypothetical protein
MLVFKALHVLSMFAAVTFLVGEALLYGRAVWRGDVTGLASVRRLVGGRPVVGVSFLMAGIVFGVLAALTGSLDLLDGWLIAAYALVVALFVLNASPWVQRLPKLGAEAIEAVAGQRPQEQVARAMAEIRTPALVAVAFNLTLFAAIILDMMVKPF